MARSEVRGSRRRQGFAGLALAVAAVAVQAQPLPVIDMHLHASDPQSYGGPQTVCTNRDEVSFPPVDPRETITVQKTAVCARPLMSVQDGEQSAQRTGELMVRHNVYGVLDVTRDEGLDASLAHAQAWEAHAPGRYWVALDFSDANLPPLDALEAQVRQGRIRLFAEVSPQYDGELATAERLAPYFALAERLDIPVGLHLGEGPPGGAHVMPGSRYSPAAGRPLDIDPLLRRHPKLRVYVMHYGSPLVEEMIALLYAHPQLYVDVAQNNWGFPRAHFYRQLQQLVDAGFAQRILFGSDQMIWPDTLPIAIETIEQAPFLTAEQKRDILYHNAARFLRLSEAQIAAHHGGAPAPRDDTPTGGAR
ncbi:MAG: amidohydrolase family protein [Sinimarinibacterium flocculans]|uniref:amidohydrolase family protein n=1 Tax=Sinimarinibacterium flocculans TaxID=985250 RepID=UPI003C69EA8E